LYYYHDFLTESHFCNWFVAGDEVDYKAYTDEYGNFSTWLANQPEEHDRQAEVAKGEWCFGWEKKACTSDAAHSVLEVFERRLYRWLVRPGGLLDGGSRGGGSKLVVRWEEAFKPNLVQCCLPPERVVIQFWVSRM
jgi:hypothetical protein